MKIIKHTVARIRNKDGKFEGIPALTGENLYQMAVRHGYVGTEDEYLAEIISDGWVTGLAEVKSDLEAATADGAITRAKLANDALYSPFVIYSSGDTIGANHIGKKLRDGNNTDYILNVAADSTIPNGAEVAVFRLWSRSLNIVFNSGTKVALEGETGLLTAPTISVPEKYSTIAMEKVMKYDGYDIWHVIGNVEVVS